MSCKGPDVQVNALAAGSALLQVAPHMAGAIDVVVVRQPDGSLRSSPFYGMLPREAQLTSECSFKQIA